ncbi:MAG TPA: Co2+/Mg2+ efflux protein ApaG [Hyphomicrobiaceae bacterium]|jgi:ApaG protein|nr:Co2+/Mg2+ efflux protein ApaG [Hyphomicrobiaceae bacterium]
MYETVTQGIRVRVTPQYLEEESSPNDGRFVWAYTVDIVNEGSETVQLRTRHWRITDASGRTEEVRGRGVVGQTPVMVPGASFRYTSSCPLTTPSGIMTGTYQMTTGTGLNIDVAVPAFSLDSPHSKPRLN